jgi:PAS domain S-box-containing protein
MRIRLFSMPKQETILIVDDAPANLSVLFEALEAEGYKVLVAPDGESALRGVAQEKPSLVLLDIMMPGINGIETCRRLKADEATREIPVIFMTALSDTHEETKGLEAGAVDYITKPFHVETVMARVKNHLRIQKMQHRLQEQNLQLQQAIATRKEAEDKILRRNLELHLIHQVSHFFSSSLDLDQVLDTILAEVQKLLDVYALSLWLVTPETEELRCRHARGPGSTELIQQSLPIGQGITGWVAQHGESLLISDTWEDDRHVRQIDEHTKTMIRSMLSVPLQARGTVIGVLNLVAPQVNHFTQDNRVFLEPIAAAAATAIEHARLYQQAQQEIDKRLETEHALAKERNLLHTVINHLPVLIYMKDTDSRFLLANEATVHAMNMTTQQELIGKSDAAFHSPELAARYAADECAVFSTGIPLIDHEEPVFDPVRGEMRYFLSTKIPLRDEQGQIIGLVGINHDITERRQMEEQLLQLQKAVETTGVGVTITNTEGRIVYSNPANAAMHGYDVEEVLNRHPRMFSAPEADKPLPPPQIPEEEAASFHWKRERTSLRKDGSTFPVRLTSTLIVDAAGKHLGRVTICEDITEQKEAEAQLLATHNELKEKNAQLAELNASKDKFFSIISHDLRSSFNILLGYANLLVENIEQYSPAELRSQAQKLQTSARRLYRLLENLLTWSRIQRGAMRYEPEYIQLNELIEETLDLFLSQAEHKTITLQPAIPSDIQVYADYQMLHTILRNLLSNALKFTPAEGRVEISARKDGAAAVEIAVADSGVGISPADVPRLFRIDSQYTHQGTAGEKGTGLGLSLCKDLVEKNQGRIWVHTEIDHGTTFRFTIPRLPGERQDL